MITDAYEFPAKCSVPTSPPARDTDYKSRWKLPLLKELNVTPFIRIKILTELMIFKFDQNFDVEMKIQSLVASLVKETKKYSTRGSSELW